MLYFYYNNSADEHTIRALSSPPHTIDKKTSIKVTKRIRSNTDNNHNLKLTLYQYQSCPFCCKVRAYLDFKGLSYDIVEVNSVTQKEIKWSSYKKVPILSCRIGDKEEVQLNDSSVIISCLETYFLEKPPNQSIEKVALYYPSYEVKNVKGKMVMQFENKYSIMYGADKKVPDDQQKVQRWREWTDNMLVHRISPNIYRSPMEAYDTFQVFAKEIFGTFHTNLIVIVGSAAMYFVGKILKRRHKLPDDVRDSLYEACNEWCRNISSTDKTSKEQKKDTIFSPKFTKNTTLEKEIFYGGKEPNLADLAVYGVLNAMEGTAAFSDVLNHTPIARWFYAVKSEINSRAGKRLKDGDVDKYAGSDDVIVGGKAGSSVG
ncbi:hypothetical protein HELRODRAFT_78591 [Helobdella robusta]|uniref:Prostaglandin E synthase 2 n=1 Tax=Helobdella robusta TaxID=6412 RepID=T1G3D5_HELRO|nr:hypothetical protein HELRODRAFT_78591 [Helobdella robusta]ESO04932.1 hypothetical protein HELRODRAFT_78591 [Helobdella robusta]